MLNPSAPCFVPCLSHTCLRASNAHEQRPLYFTEEAFIRPADYLTASELDELEACDDWCELTAYFDEIENDHLVALALMHAPQHKISEIEKRACIRQRASGNIPMSTKRPVSSRQSRVRPKGVGGLFQPQRTN